MALSRVDEISLVWLQAAGCSGCSVSLLNSASPGIGNILLDEIVPTKHLNLVFHPNVMAGQGEHATRTIEELARDKKGGFVLLVEGAIPMANGGNYGYLGEKNSLPVSFASWVEALGKDAMVVAAVGTCAAFGGIPAGNPNPTQCISVGDFFNLRSITTPYINIPGCPPHPDWLVGALAQVILGGLPKEGDLDDCMRPRVFFGQLVHDNCPRRAYYDEGKFARKLSDTGCLLELGCKGPVTYADCPLRHWNNKTSWCIGAGSPCLGCVEPGFPDVLSPLYVKMEEVVLPRIGAGSR